MKEKSCINPKTERQSFFDLACADRDTAIALIHNEGIKSHIICFHSWQAVKKI